MTTPRRRLAATIALAAVTMLGISSCSLTVNRSSDASSGGATTKSQDEPRDKTTSRASEEAPPTATPAAHDDLRTTMTPPGGAVVDFATRSEGEVLVLTSSDSLDALTTFYEGALAQLGAQKETASGSQGSWKFEGTYDGGTDIGVAVIDCDVLPEKCLWGDVDLAKKNGSVRLVGVATGDGWIQFSS